MTDSEGKPMLFDVVDPPAGGANAFRRRIALERRKRVRRHRVLAGTAASTVVLLAVFAVFGALRTTPSAPAADLDFDLVRMRLGTLATPAAAVTIATSSRADVAALELHSTDSKVLIYLVASRIAPAPETDPASGQSEGDESPESRPPS